MNRFIVGALAVGIALGACSSEDVVDKAIEGATDGEVDIDLDAGEVSVENDDGSIQATLGADLPDGFPEDVVIPDEFMVIHASSQVIGDMSGFVVIGNVPSPLDDVRSMLEGAYGEPTELTELDEYVSLSFVVGPHLVNYGLQPDADGNTGLTISVGLDG